jgi:hypothetical protein
MKRAVVCLFVVFASGCSSSHQIAASSNDITQAAHNSRGRFVWIADEAIKPAPNLPGIHTTALEGIEEQDTIIESAARIVYALPGVKDITPFWAELLVWGMVFLSLVGAVIVLIHSGFISLIQRLLSRLWVKKSND